MSPIQPRVSVLSPRATKLIYQLPQSRIYCCHPYPRLVHDAPEAIFYGHDFGITALYRPDSDRDFTASYTIHLGTPVYALSFAPECLIVPPDGQEQVSRARALIAKSIVFAATCRDRTVRLISLPLRIPAAGESGIEQILTLGGGASSHQSPATSVSLSLLPSEAQKDELIIASTSSDNTGLLVIQRVPITSSSQLPAMAPKPLCLPLFSCPTKALSFNPSPTSQTRRHHILVPESTGAIRIFDTRSGSWLASFHAPFARTSDRRKGIIAAEWCIGGRGIVVLLEGGEWGIWDLESTLSEDAGIGFALGGVVGEDWTSLASGKRRKRNSGTATEWDDDTSTVITASAYSSGTAARAAGEAAAGGMSGGIAALQKPGTELAAQIDDEAIAIIYGDSMLYISSLKRFWKAEGLQQQKAKKSATGLVVREIGAAGDVGFLGEDLVTVGLGVRIAVVEIEDEKRP